MRYACNHLNIIKFWTQGSEVKGKRKISKENSDLKTDSIKNYNLKLMVAKNYFYIFFWRLPNDFSNMHWSTLKKPNILD